MAVALAVAVVAAMAVAASPSAVARGAHLLAYEAPDGIHLATADGRGDRLLGGTEPGDQNPEWSPRGDRVVLWSDAVGAGDVFVIDVGSGRRMRLTDSAEDDVHTDWFPSWSPDGATIVFNSDRAGGDDWTIYTVPAAGGLLRRVTKGWGHASHQPGGSPSSLAGPAAS